MKKRTLSFALALVMCLSLLPTVMPSAAAALPDGSIIKDVYLYELILERLGKPYGYVITPEDARSLTWLDVSVASTNPTGSNPRRIYSLAGIEYFTELTYFNCSGQPLYELDVSGNTKLTSLNCAGNYLKTLDVSKLSALEYLLCDNNYLTSLNVGGLSKLLSLSCENNRLTTLNVSGSIKLNGINVRNNRLTTIDVTGLGNLRGLTVDGNYMESRANLVGTDTTLLVVNGVVHVALDSQKPLSERDTALASDAQVIANLSKPAPSGTGTSGTGTTGTALSPLEHNQKLYDESAVKKDAIERINGGQTEFAQEITTLAKEITKGISGDRSKALAIHVWIAENIAYNYDWNPNRIEPIFITPLDVLKYNYTVCDGYARLNAALLGAAGIPAVYVSGDPVGSGESHAWNEIYLDGKWVISDVTNDSRYAYEDAKFSKALTETYDASWTGDSRFDLTHEWLSRNFRIRGYSIIEVKEPANQPNPLDSASSWARADIIDAIERGFVPDHLKSSYKNEITRKEFCYMAVRWLMHVRDEGITDIVGGASRDGGYFTDTNDYYVRYAYRLYITSGTSSNTFSPNGLITREQAAVMIMNACVAAGIDVSNTASAGFTDISSASSWAVDAINFVRNAGIMSGTGDNKFSPKATYTREQSIITFNNIVAPTPLPRGEPNPDFEYSIVGNSVTIFGHLDFSGTADMVVIPATIEGRPVTAIGSRAFDSTKTLVSVSIPNTVTSIGDLAFAGCTSLTQITIPNSVTSIGFGAFTNCTSLTTISIPNSVSSIGDDAFGYCTRLTSVTIPASVTSIGRQAFIGCTGLSTARFEGNTPTLGMSLFYGCTSLLSVYFEGDAPTSESKYVFHNCAPGFTVYYRAGTNGWSNPWNSYPTATW